MFSREEGEKILNLYLYFQFCTTVYKFFVILLTKLSIFLFPQLDTKYSKTKSTRDPQVMTLYMRKMNKLSVDSNPKISEFGTGFSILNFENSKADFSEKFRMESEIHIKNLKSDPTLFRFFSDFFRIFRNSIHI